MDTDSNIIQYNNPGWKYDVHLQNTVSATGLFWAREKPRLQNCHLQARQKFAAGRIEWLKRIKIKASMVKAHISLETLKVQ